MNNHNNGLHSLFIVQRAISAEKGIVTDDLGLQELKTVKKGDILKKLLG
jgi:hypothetical protein